METYKGKITEFVDWVTGYNELTEKTLPGVSPNTPISGESIRNLLQERLKKPFVYHEDTKNGLYRLFSSNEAKDEWIKITNDGKEKLDEAEYLQLFDFVRPGDTAITTNLDSSPRYIIAGDNLGATVETNPAIIEFYVRMQKEVAGTQQYISDVFTVTYEILDSNGKITTISDAYGKEYVLTQTSEFNEQYIIRRNIYSYLTEGTNTVTVTTKALNSSAESSVSIPISFVSFKLESSYDYTKGLKYNDPQKPIKIPIQIKRSVTNLPLTVSVYVDNTIAKYTDGSDAIWTTNSTENIVTNSINIANTYAPNTVTGDHIKHTIKVVAEMAGGTRTLYSNQLFYDFETISNTQGIRNSFVNVAYDTPANNVEYDQSKVILQATQYAPFILNWAYYTDLTNEQTASVLWQIKKLINGEYRYTDLGYLQGNNGKTSTPLNFIPTEPIYLSDRAYLVAKIGNTEVDTFPIIVAKSQFTLNETSGIAFKISAYGKSNSSQNPKSWEPSIGQADVLFSFDKFDNVNGWVDNALVLYGTENRATINYDPISENPMENGKTIEFEFLSDRVDLDDDIILQIGDPTSGNIKVTPTSAGLYIGNTAKPKIKTDFKANERVKLAFIFNANVGQSDPNSGLIYIVNNGILERAVASAGDVYESAVGGDIKIGGSNSGIKFYSMRIYDTAISYTQELDNYIYDVDEKAPIISRNEIVRDLKINYELTKTKIDTILIEGVPNLPNEAGNLNKLFRGEGKSECVANITRTCVTDATKNFKVYNARLRKHGQSTLTYPITSLKMWFNKSGIDGLTPTLELSAVLAAMNLNKNRYIMKDGAIPSNKFVLQANYADSSGVHNGGIERLINDSWYNAQFKNSDQSTEYKLRTAPLLFASGTTINHNKDIVPEDRIEGFGVGKAANKTWPQTTGKEFPYKIRTAPDSFACAVFYKNIEDTSETFLGQYVFMDDKKSDYSFGERSIYSFDNNSDPFVLNTNNTKNGSNFLMVNGQRKGQDVDANKVWDNKDVLRVEVVLPNYLLTSYMSFNVDTNVTIDENGEVSETSGQKVPCTDIKYDKSGNKLGYYWESFFDLIYPDPEDIEENSNVDKYNPNSNFNRKTKPFLDWLRWITSIGELRLTSGAAAALAKFEEEAVEHLDLYKLAAYYIFFLRFGLVDSVERNAQLKTYDGQHWHYEPWDMDIALGNTNQGALVFTPPMTRNTFIPGTSTYAFSGRTIGGTSNVLWDCLEAWDVWANQIVPEVAQALYKGGLTYTAASKIFDKDYVEKWSETIYNESGYYKYILNGGSSWLSWLQGSRTSHRHWWLSTSMNYYDAKWSCGEFNEHRAKFFADKAGRTAQPGEDRDIIIIKPTSSTFFKLTQNEGTAQIDLIECNPTSPALFDVTSNVFSAKDPSHIYGATFIEEIDVSCLAKSLNSLNLSQCYDEVLGARVKKVNVGIPYVENNSTSRTGYISNTAFSLFGIDKNEGLLNDALQNITELNVTGQSNITGGLSSLLDGRKNITNLYAIGTAITAFENSPTGNLFNNIELPSYTVTTGEAGDTSVLNSITFNDASWQNLSFWKAEYSSVLRPITEIVDGEEVAVTDENNNIIYHPNPATFTKTSIPAELRALLFKGSTASNSCAGKLLLEWIDQIEQYANENNTTFESLAKHKIFEAKNINWGAELNIEDRVNISYATLEKISKFNNGENLEGILTGYIRISDPEPLTATQLSNIKKWFGNGAFDLSNRNSNLIIDQNVSYVLISVSGNENEVIVDGDNVTVKEPYSAILSANKFLLGTDDTEYTWELSTNNILYQQDSIGTVHISVGDDGVTRLITSPSVNGNYTLYVRVSYTDSNNYLHVSDPILIEIEAVTYPTDWSWLIGNNVREFKQTTDIARDVFGPSQGNYIHNGQLIPAYVLPSGGTDFLFKVNPTTNDYTALTNSIVYKVEGRADYSDEYLEITQNSINSGLTIHTKKIPQEMLLYKITAIISVGAAEVYKYINLIVWDDNSPILPVSASPLFGVISSLYATLYSVGGNIDYYKTRLMSLYGEIDFSAQSQLSSLVTNNNKSIFYYLPNISSIVFDGNSNIQSLTDNNISGEDKRIFNLSNCTKLTSFTFVNNENISGELDLSERPEITTVDLSGTILGIKLPVGSNIQSLSLGNPSSVYINSPKTLQSSGVSVEDTTNIENITLISVNVGDLLNNVSSTLHGYNIFNTLYS